MPPGLWPESTSTEPSLSLSMTRSTLCLEAFLGKDSFILLFHKYTSAGHQPRVSDLRIYFLGSESVKSSWLFEKESLASGTTQKPSWFSLLKNFPWWPGAQMEMLLQTNIMTAIIFQISPTCSRGFVFLGIWAPAQGILIGECGIQQAQSLPWVLKENMAQGGCCLPLVHACSWTWLVGCVPWPLTLLHQQKEVLQIPSAATCPQVSLLYPHHSLNTIGSHHLIFYLTLWDRRRTSFSTVCICHANQHLRESSNAPCASPEWLWSFTHGQVDHEEMWDFPRNPRSWKNPRIQSSYSSLVACCFFLLRYSEENSSSISLFPISPVSKGSSPVLPNTSTGNHRQWVWSPISAPY